MVTAPKAYGSYVTAIQCGAPEPPGVTKVRSAFDSVMNQVLREFINQSVHATQIGIKELDVGDYVTLDKLEEMINKG